MTSKSILLTTSELEATTSSATVQREIAFADGRITVVGSDGSFSQTDTSQWHRVYAERRRLKLPERDVPASTHPLVGKTLRERDTGKPWVVESVTRQWLAGFADVALLRDEFFSHTTQVVHNHSSVAPDFVRGHESFVRRFGEQMTR